MRIERIDDKTVKCFLSNEELEEYQIDYKDFVLRSEKAKQVVQDIITQAAEQVGYRPPRFAFDMQIMLLPDQGLLLTFSEGESINIPGAQQLMEYLREMKETIQKTKEELGIAMGESGDTSLPVQQGQALENQQNRQKQQKAEKPGKAIFAFDSLGQVMNYAAVLPANLRVQSSLYEMEGVYYLYLQKGNAAYERYSRACVQALEFSRLYGTEETLLLPMAEHGGCLIKERAVQKLRG